MLNLFPVNPGIPQLLSLDAQRVSQQSHAGEAEAVAKPGDQTRASSHLPKSKNQVMVKQPPSPASTLCAFIAALASQP